MCSCWLLVGGLGSLGVAQNRAVAGWAFAEGGGDDGEEDFEERAFSSFATSGGMWT